MNIKEKDDHLYFHELEKNDYQNTNNFALVTGSGLSRDNLINIMLNLKCQTALNLDGGGSIALLFKSKNSNTIETIIGNGRNVTEVVYFTE